MDGNVSILLKMTELLELRIKKQRVKDGSVICNSKPEVLFVVIGQMWNKKRKMTGKKW